MNDLVSFKNGEAVTTSMTIADGTENEHASVIRLVRTYLDDLNEFGRVGFEIEPFETAGGTQKREVALLNEQQSTLVLTYMRNTDIVRAFKKRLVKAFWELLRQRSVDPLQVFNDPSAMRSLLLNYTEKVIALEDKVDELVPKAEALDRIASTDGLLCITDAAKTLQVRPKDLFVWMRAHEWIFKRPGSRRWRAYQHRIQCGLMEHKAYPVLMEDGSEKICDQAMVTPRGLAKLSETFVAESIH